MDIDVDCVGGLPESHTTMELDSDIVMAPPQMDLDCDFDMAPPPMDLSPDGPAMHVASSENDYWRPGYNVGRWLGRSRRGRSGRVELQTQVLLVNGCMVIDRLPKDKQELLRAVFEPVGSCAGSKLAAKILSGILCVNAKTIQNT